MVSTSTDGSLHGGDYVDKHAADPKVELMRDEATEIAIDTIDQEFTIVSDNSPFPEVRANVPNTDDVDLPVNTVRMWFLGIVFTMQPILLNAISKCHDYLTRRPIAELSSRMSPRTFASFKNIQAIRSLELQDQS